MKVVHAQQSVADIWGRLSSAITGSADDTRAVVNFVGRDWLTMRIHEKGTDWAIDPSSREIKKSGVAHRILQAKVNDGRVVWINLAYGRHRATKGGEVFCNTRYGLTGFQKAVELAQGTGGLEVINICLNYFRRHKPRETFHESHCRNCVSVQSLDDIRRLRTRNDMLASVLDAVLGSDQSA